METFSLNKTINFLLFFILSTVILYYAKDLFIPILFGGLFSMLFIPLSNKIESRGVHRALAAIICILIFLATIAGVIWLLSWQISDLTENVSQMRQQFSEMMKKVQQYLAETWNISFQKQQEILNNQKSSAGSGVSKLAATFAGSLFSLMVNFVLVLVYIFLFMFFRSRLRKAILKMVPNGEKNNTEKIVRQTTQVSQQYLTGLGSMIVILWIMYSIGFSIVGVKNAFFFAILCGLLEIVPFVGNLTGTSITVLMVLAQGGNTQMIIGVLVTYLVIQFVQTYILEPLVVGAKVNINPLFTILILVAAEMLWGIAGMVLAIPLLGIVKIICDHIEPLKPYGYLIGEESKPQEDSQWIKKLKALWR